MYILIDTNVLLRFADRNQPQHPLVWKSVHQLYNKGNDLVTTFQNCAEFWNVATRPKEHNGFGIEQSNAKEMLRLIERLFPILWHNEDSYQHWKTIISEYSVSGVQVHDARLVALMLTHKVDQILTFNNQDFKRYEPAGIRSIHPNNISV